MSEVDLPPYPGVMRRLGARLYDLFLLLSVWFMATVLAIVLNHGHAVTEKKFAFQMYLLLVGFVFYGWFWTHGGQTLGMRAWRLHLRSIDGSAVSWGQAARRFFCSLGTLGISVLWIHLHPQRRSWHDRWSKTELVMLEKRTKQAQSPPAA